jgi:hypothetical protein
MADPAIEARIKCIDIVYYTPGARVTKIMIQILLIYSWMFELIHPLKYSYTM